MVKSSQGKNFRKSILLFKESENEQTDGGWGQLYGILTTKQVKQYLQWHRLLSHMSNQ